jgi:hypothetical protein
MTMSVTLLQRTFYARTGILIAPAEIIFEILVFLDHELWNLDWPMKSNHKTYSAEKHPAFVGRAS